MNLINASYLISVVVLFRIGRKKVIASNSNLSIMPIVSREIKTRHIDLQSQKLVGKDKLKQVIKMEQKISLEKKID
jgi:hypothetical protein